MGEGERGEGTFHQAAKLTPFCPPYLPFMEACSAEMASGSRLETGVRAVAATNGPAAPTRPHTSAYGWNDWMTVSV